LIQRANSSLPTRLADRRPKCGRGAFQTGTPLAAKIIHHERAGFETGERLGLFEEARSP
jgi:hypothetical protein